MYYILCIHIIFWLYIPTIVVYFFSGENQHNPEIPDDVIVQVSDSSSIDSDVEIWDTPVFSSTESFSQGKSKVTANSFLQFCMLHAIVASLARLYQIFLLEKNIIEQYQTATITESPTYRVYVNRMTSDFANDALAIYKVGNNKLCSPFSVKFENETSVERGPVREFFSLLTEMMNGFPAEGENKPCTLVFEGEDNHKVPVANALLRNTGFYLSIGRMIAHSFLHGGPPIFGLSLAVVQYIASDDKEEISDIQFADIPYIDLRSALLEVHEYILYCYCSLPILKLTHTQFVDTVLYNVHTY